MSVRGYETQFEQSYERKTKMGVGVFKLLAAIVLVYITFFLTGQTRPSKRTVPFRRPDKRRRPRPETDLKECVSSDLPCHE